MSYDPNSEFIKKKFEDVCVCTRPWTTMEERHVFGEYRVCCWMQDLIGKSAKDETHDFMPLWKSEAVEKIRHKLIKGKSGDICTPFCPVIRNRRNYFDKVEFFSYEPDEYSGFDSAFIENREKVIESILQKRVKIDTYPLRLKLHPSNLCNLNCRMCNLDRKSRVSVSKAYIDNLVKLLPYLENLDVFGGEPFCCETARWIMFSGILKHYPHTHFSTVTNGTLLNASALEQLKGVRLGNIEFSLDASTAETYEKIRIGADFKTTMENVDRFVKERDMGNVSVKYVGALFVIQDINYHEISSFIELTHSKGITPDFCFVGGSSELQFLIDEVKESIQEGIKKADQLNEGIVKANLNYLLQGYDGYIRQMQKIKLASVFGEKWKSSLLGFFNRQPKLRRVVKKVFKIR
ncbi:MAG: radical SAM protein [Spirochaetales bacterium]|nr:radical SAM protein [Spirochaetales bacterium]